MWNMLFVSINCPAAKTRLSRRSSGQCAALPDLTGHPKLRKMLASATAAAENREFFRETSILARIAVDAHSWVFYCVATTNKVVGSANYTYNPLGVPGATFMSVGH